MARARKAVNKGNSSRVKAKPKPKAKPRGRGRGKSRDDDDENREEEAKHMEISPDFLQRLKRYDIKNYPIPENLCAAYRMDGKQRLMIEKMVVENFKSYYGKHVIGPFHPHFSAIVGANGSGKSNIIDALMFVFGTNAAKIRSTNLKALIHKSAAHQNLSHCSVTVFFVLCHDEDTGKYTSVAGSNFEVKRTVTNKGTSKYHYNGDTYNRDELRSKLQSHGIDMDHHRFLILQGEVESISMMKPKAEKENDKGLLEYLDDIIGTSRLRGEVIKLDNTVIAVDALRQKQLMKVQEYDKMKNKLLKPVREIVRIVLLDNKISHSKHRLLSIQIHNKNNSLEQSRIRKEEVDALLTQETEQLKQIVDGNTEAKAAVTKKTKELDEAQNSERKQNEQLDREQMKLKRNKLNLDKAEKLLNDSLKEKSKVEDSIKKIENRPAKNNAEAEKLKNELDEVKAKMDEIRPELQQKNEEAASRTAQLEKDRGEIGTGLSEAKKAEDEANAKLTLAQGNLLRMREPLEKFQRRYEEGQRALDKAEEEYAEEKRKIEETTSKLSTLEPRYNNALHQVESLTQREQQLSSKLSASVGEFERAKKEKNTSQTSNKTFELLMEEKRSGRIPGICGRLGDLGNIDPKYDVAISTTTNLDYIVTDTFETTNKCLAFMAKHPDLPRRTFLALDKIEKIRNDMKSIRTPMNYPRLFDLVKPTKPEYAIAFYFALRNTIVCDDIIKAREASNLNGEKWRVVTLDADVVETSGTLTGGGSAKKRGRIGTNLNASTNTFSEVELASLQRKIEEYNKELHQIREQLSRMMVEKTEVTTSYEREKGYLQKLKNSIKQREEDVNFLRTNITPLKDDFEKEKALLTDEKIATIKNQVVKLTEERDELTNECEAIQEKYDHLSSEIATLYDSVAGEIKVIFDKYQNREKDIEKKLADLRKSSSKADIDLKNASDNLKAVLQKLEIAEKDIQKYKDENDESEQIIERLKVLLNEKEDIVKKLEAEIKEETEKSDQNSEDEVKLKKSIKEKKAESDALKVRMSKATDMIDHSIAQIDALKLHNITDILDDESFNKKPKKKGKKGKNDDDDSDGTDLSDYDMEDEDEDDGTVPMEVDEEAPSPNPGPGDDEVDENRLTHFLQYTPEQIESFDVEFLKDEYENFQTERSGLKTALNLNVLAEYRKRASEFKEQEAHLYDLCLAVNNVRSVYDRFVNQRLEEFNDALTKINEYLRNQYYSLSLGGEAYLQTVSPMDPYSDGIKFIVRPKSKGWREIALTSGGEKTISSLSLVFALHQFLPTPFYVMDEIDAALDFRNVEMISKFVKEKTKNSQFIIISLRDNMYRLANSLIGVYKVNDKAQTCLLRHEVKNANKKRRSCIMPA
uniref:Structural maintenance of chromosomes protein n=1 Tax=Panagrolaimus sp. ES5 TaxID=591445 RepID=A0AC34GQN4_9BILA